MRVEFRIGLNERYRDLVWRGISSWCDRGWLCGKQLDGTHGLYERVLKRSNARERERRREGASGIAEGDPPWATRWPTRHASSSTLSDCGIMAAMAGQATKVKKATATNSSCI